MVKAAANQVREDFKTHFAFGENWSAYADKLTLEQIDQARNSFARLAGGNLSGKKVLDIGCGSGLHALAALQCGAEHVTAIDIDENSVATARGLLDKYWNKKNYECRTGNILTGAGIPDGGFDIVYSWGVLHHTGALWEAVGNAAGRVRPGGKFIIALYLKTPFCGLWEKEKRFFTRAPRLVQMPVTWLYSALCILRLLAKGINPLRFIREYHSNRGMSWWHDRIDWLGGWPYESAAPQEVEKFMRERGFALESSFDTAAPFGLLGTGCAEYVFVRKEG